MGIQFTKHPSYLHIEVDGLWNIETAKVTQENAIQIMNEDNLNKLILDISKTNNSFTIDQIYEINTRVPQIFPSHFKHAIIFSFDMMNLVEANYSENVAQNRSINIRMFDSIQAAKEWLAV